MNNRLDSAHQQRPPHAKSLPEQLLPELVIQLEEQDISFSTLIEQLQPYPQIIRRILQSANSVTTGKWQSTTCPVQGASYLGTRRLVQILLNMYVETFGTEMPRPQEQRSVL